MLLLTSVRSKVYLAAVLSLAFCAGAFGSAEALRARHQSLLPALQDNVFDAPIHVESEDKDGRMRGDVFGIVDYGFEAVRTMLMQPAHWCEFLLLHPNMKYCEYRPRADKEVTLTLYTGKKNYLPVESTRRNEYQVKWIESTEKYLNAQVSAAQGPIDTSDYLVTVEAIPIDGARSFLRVGFSYRYGPLTRTLSAAYFSTIGRSKVGFSVVGQDKKGEPIFVGGRVGSLERTVMRTYLALQTWLEGKTQPEADRLEWRLRRWYTLTERYRRQLHEFEEDEYLDAKRREYAGRLTPVEQEKRASSQIKS
jgi:hypothetical protein